MTLNDMAVQIWEYCLEAGLHISAAHIPGAHNVLADTASREFTDSAEWAIPTKTFDSITRKFGLPEIDLFASRLNNKLDRYVSWKPDPGSTFIDAMSLPWDFTFVYIFPPFSMLWPIITKLEQEGVAKTIMIIPDWPTQSWYPRIMGRSLCGPIRISSKKLYLPGTRKIHPWRRK